MSARAIAFRVHLRELRTRAWLNLALDAELRAHPGLARQEMALATELVYGVARRALALDAALAPHYKGAMAKLEPAVLAALRLGAYQLLYLDRIPVHAAVGETVELMKREGLARAAGLANALLRRVAEARAIPLPDDPLERLSVEESHPLWLVRRWAARHGLDEARELCRANNLPGETTLRANLCRTSREALLAALAAEGLEARPTPLSPCGVRLARAGEPTRLASFEEGLFQLQGEAEQLIAPLLAPTPGERILDACAAPGGKSCHLAELLTHAAGTFGLPSAQPPILCADLSAKKLARLSSEARRLGHAALLSTAPGDLKSALPPGALFDKILLDAPCSALGTLQRHPELRYRRTEEEVRSLAAEQRALLAAAAAHLAPGGVLVYAVCSNEPEEGALQLEAAGALDLSPEMLPKALYGSEEIQRALSAGPGAIETFPHRHQTAGFFAVRLRKTLGQKP